MFVLWSFFLSILFVLPIIVVWQQSIRPHPEYVALPFFFLFPKRPISSISYRSTNWQNFETNQIVPTIETYCTFNEWTFCIVIYVPLFFASNIGWSHIFITWWCSWCKKCSVTKIIIFHWNLKKKKSTVKITQQTKSQSKMCTQRNYVCVLHAIL